MHGLPSIPQTLRPWRRGPRRACLQDGATEAAQASHPAMTRLRSEDRFDVVVIGGGAGGLSVASVAARLGQRVALIEASGELGGECLHTGCVPSKTLIRSARVAQLMRRGDEFGVAARDPEPDMAAVNARVRRVVGRLQHHDDPARFEAYGVEVIFGVARFLDPHHVETAGRRLYGRRFVLATGSLPWVPPIPGLSQAGYWTNETLFGVSEAPRRLAIIGAGPVGVEMAQAFQRLGWTVTLMESREHILPGEDAGAAEALRAVLEAEGATVHTSARVAAIDAGTDGHVLYLADGSQVVADRILVAAGRKAATGGLDLHAAGVTLDEGGTVAVDSRQRTRSRHIFAVGDVCGPYHFSHLASYQAGVVIQNALFRVPARADLRALPRVVYSDPELAQVGMTVAEAEQRHGDIEVHRADFADLDRAVAEGEDRGYVRIVFRRGRIVGATVLGAHAGEMLPQLVQAVRGRLSPRDIVAAVHAYPTLAEIIKRAVEPYYGERLFRPRVRTLVRWLDRLLP